MAHYDRYLELLAQHNATGRAEDALQPLPCWDRSVARASAPKVLRYLHARGGEARRLAILLGDALASPSAAVAPSRAAGRRRLARARRGAGRPRPSSPRCVAADPMEVEPQAPAPAPPPAERTRPLGAGAALAAGREARVRK